MKRWIFKLVVFLLLGAIVNVAVAWGCAKWEPQWPDRRARFVEDGASAFLHPFVDLASWPYDTEAVSEVVRTRASTLIGDRAPEDAGEWHYSAYRDGGFGWSNVEVTAIYYVQSSRLERYARRGINVGLVGRAMVLLTGWPFPMLSQFYLPASENPERTWALQDTHVREWALIVDSSIWGILLWVLVWLPTHGQQLARKAVASSSEFAKRITSRFEQLTKGERLVVKLTTFLVFGVLVNIALTWLCALTLDPSIASIERATTLQAGVRWQVTRADRAGITWCASLRLPEVAVSNPFGGLPPTAQSDPQQLAPAWTGFDHPTDEFLTGSPDGPFGPVVEQRIVDGRGWPMTAMWSELDSRVLYSESAWRSGLVRGGIRTSLPPWRITALGYDQQPRVLPLRPVWTGFAINSVLFAAVLWTPFVPFTLRRLIRRKRGHCIKCGYDLRGVEHEVCPECGVEVS